MMVSTESDAVAAAVAEEEGWHYYLGTLEHPSAVFQSFYANFIDYDTHNLIISKTDRIEVYNIKKDGLEASLRIPINGRITILKKLRPSNSQRDYLFIVTEKEKFAVLSWESATQKIITVSCGDLYSRGSRPTERGHLVAVHRSVIAVQILQGLVSLLLIEGRSRELKFRDPIIRRIEELCIHDICIIDGEENCPRLVILSEFPNGGKSLSFYRIDGKDGTLSPVQEKYDDLEADSHYLVPVQRAAAEGPSGVLVVADESILYYEPNTKIRCGVAMKPTRITCHCVIDRARFLLGDSEGNLYVLFLAFGTDQTNASSASASASGSAPTMLRIQQLGKTCIASTLTYLDNGYVYVGSHYGPSQIIQLMDSRIGDGGSFVKIVEEQQSLAPIVDFITVDLEKIGQNSLIACCGGMQHGSLKLIRKGTNLNICCSYEIKELIVKQIFAIGKNLFLSCVDGTRILSLNNDVGDLNEIDDMHHEGAVEQAFLSWQGKYSLLIGDFGEYLIQVTSSGVVFVHGDTGKSQVWKAPSMILLCAASENDDQFITITDDGRLEYFHSNQLNPSGSFNLVSKQASSCTLFTVGLQHVAMVAFWDREELQCVDIASGTSFLVNLQTLQLKHSLAVLRIAGQSLVILVGLGDGHLLSIPLDTSAFAEMKHLTAPVQRSLLGTEPVKIFQYGETTFACSSRPFLVEFTRGKVTLSLTNIKNVHAMCYSEEIQMIIAVTDEELLYTSLDNTKSPTCSHVHYQSLDFGETISKVIHLPSCKAYVLISSNQPLETTLQDADEATRLFHSKVQLIEQDTFKEMGEHRLGEGERAHSLVNFYNIASNMEMIIVGTAIAGEVGHEPRRGRLLTFVIGSDQKQLSLLNSLEVPGCVYAMRALDGKLVVTINGTTNLYRWGRISTAAAEENWKLVHSHSGNVLGIKLDVSGKTVVVGDLMRSISLFTTAAAGEKLVEIARDHDALWMTEVKLFGEEGNVLAADNLGNLLVMEAKRNENFDYRKFEVGLKSVMHIGQVVNKISAGSLLQNYADDPSPLFEPHLIGTTCGGLYLFGRLPAAEGKLLRALQANMLTLTPPIGGLAHHEWRSMATERKQRREVQQFIDGDVIAKFLELAPKDRAMVVKGTAKEMPSSIKCTADSLTLLVESLVALHSS